MNVIGHRLVALALTFATSLLVGCSTQSPSEQGDVSATDGLLGHVHGLGIDPGDDTLYVASHYGVFRVTDGKPERVADRWRTPWDSPSSVQDTSLPADTRTSARTSRQA
jgi:hypothetical protein